MTTDFSWAEIGSRIRDLRQQQARSQRDLANKAGMTQAGLARLESGQTNPQLETLRRIAAALGTTIRQLFVDERVVDDVPPHPVLQRVARVLRSGDNEAVQTIESAVQTAETLLRRGGRFVTAPLSAEAQQRVNRIKQLTGWKLDERGAIADNQLSKTAKNQTVFSARPRITTPTDLTRNVRTSRKPSHDAKKM